MKAVILAAGRGTRIEKVTGGRPKSLIQFDGRAILDYQIEGLWAAGVSEIGIVIGHKGELIVDHIERTFGDYLDSFHFIENPAYATTNNICSLWLAREWAESSDFYCLNADVLLHPDILLPERESRLVSMIADPAWRDETMKVVVRNGDIVKMSKGIPRSDYSATYIGITLFSRQIAPVVFDEIGEMIAEGQTNVFFNAAVQRLVDSGLRVGLKPTRGLPWAEVDDESDLAFARKEVHPYLPSFRPCFAPGTLATVAA